VPLADLEPEARDMEDALLVCATELTTGDEIARFAAALAHELSGRPRDAGRVVVTSPGRV